MVLTTVIRGARYRKAFPAGSLSVDSQNLTKSREKLSKDALDVAVRKCRSHQPEVLHPNVCENKIFVQPVVRSRTGRYLDGRRSNRQEMGETRSSVANRARRPGGTRRCSPRTSVLPTAYLNFAVGKVSSARLPKAVGVALFSMKGFCQGIA